MMKDERTELWDLYTSDRVRTGRTMRRCDECPAGLYHLVVHVCIFWQGKMLLQQRQPFKDGWPDLWDVTAGGSALAGDTSQAAAERELWEEMGVALSLDGRLPALTMTFPDGFDDYYIVQKDISLDALRLQPEEVQAAKWADKEEIFRMIDAGTFLPVHKSAIELLFWLSEHDSVLTEPAV